MDEGFAGEGKANGRDARSLHAGDSSAGAGYTFTGYADGHTGEAWRAFATEAVHSSRKPQTPTLYSGRPEERLEQHVMYLRRELKVCEGCGGLWVRTGAEAGVYCRTCSALVADLPGRRRRSPGRPCKVHNAGGARLQIVAATATGEPSQRLRGRCVRGAEEQRMEETAAERRAGMALVRLSGISETHFDDAVAVEEASAPVLREIDAADDAVAMPRKPAGRVVLSETFAAVAMVGGAR